MNYTIYFNGTPIMLVLLLWVTLNLFTFSYSKHKIRDRHHELRIYGPYRKRTTANSATRKICLNTENTVKARHRSCLLRPDTGPCRADIIQWYYDVTQRRCYRFYWGGCQGNGNRFETRHRCKTYCFLNATSVSTHVPHFCSLAFEYGDCFGYFYRWGWDKMTKTCKRYMYSGCGGNQNNFETNIECMNTCLSVPNNTLLRSEQLFTTCLPLNILDLQ